MPSPGTFGLQAREDVRLEMAKRGLVIREV